MSINQSFSSDPFRASQHRPAPVPSIDLGGIESILVPLDGSTTAEGALSYATLVAQSFGSTITLLQVLESPDAGSRSVVDPVEWSLARGAARAYLEGVVARLRDQGFDACSLVVDDQPERGIVEAVTTSGADLVVMTSHGRGEAPFRLGRTARQVLGEVGCSVLLVPSPVSEMSLEDLRTSQPPGHANTNLGETRSFGLDRILVPVDGSVRSDYAYQFAIRLGQKQLEELILVRVVQVPEIAKRVPITNEEQRLVDRIVERVEGEARRHLDGIRSSIGSGGPKVRPIVKVAERVFQAIEEVVMTERPTLVVMSAHGSGCDERCHHGSVAAQLMVNLGQPVLVLQDLEIPMALRASA